MKENTLLKIALICSLAGLVVLYFISAKIEVSDYKPAKLNLNIGDEVKLKGTVTKVSIKDNVVFIEVNQQNAVNVVVFSDDKNLTLKNGDDVEIVGEVQEYKGNEEVIANQIRVIR